MNSLRPNISWRKNRLAARVLYRQRRGGILRERDVRVARSLALDSAISARLLDQAMSSLEARYGVAKAC